jgi:hypothetical protein
MAINDAAVKAVIDTDRDTTPFIATAQLIVDEDLADKGLSAGRLDQVVLYLAAHFVAVTEEKGGLTSERLGEAEDTYRAPSAREKGLAATRYGQQAMLLDNSGTLASLSTNVGLKARFGVIGQDMTQCWNGIWPDDWRTVL